MSVSNTIEITPAQVRAAQGRRREVHNVLPPNIDRRTPLEQWDSRVAAICDRALLHLSFNAELAAEMERGRRLTADAIQV